MRPVGSELREKVRAAPGVERLLATLEGLPPAYLVGGMPRDLLRGVPALDLDVAVEGDGVTAAQEIARRLRGTVVRHERFGTATVTADQVVIDVASTRTELYVEPGALPRVRWSSLREDLAPLHSSTSPFAEQVPRVDAAGATWVHPVLVCEVQSLGLTSSRRLRQPAYRGLRPDLTPGDLDPGDVDG